MGFADHPGLALEHPSACFAEHTGQGLGVVIVGEKVRAPVRIPPPVGGQSHWGSLKERSTSGVTVILKGALGRLAVNK